MLPGIFWLDRTQSMLTPRGRLRADVTKGRVSIRFSPEVMAHFKASGVVWQTRIDAALRQFISVQPGHTRPLTQSGSGCFRTLVHAALKLCKCLGQPHQTHPATAIRENFGAKSAWPIAARYCPDQSRSSPVRPTSEGTVVLPCCICTRLLTLACQPLPAICREAVALVAAVGFVR